MNTLYYGDNLDILHRYIEEESVDLIYLDPPFKSNQDYNVLFREQDGSRAASQILAFEDTWEWNQASAASYYEVVEAGGDVSQAMKSFFTLLGGNDMMAYLSMMAPRLVELRHVLKPTGSIYLHCDPTASAHLRILMDAVFGPQNFRNEIIWCYRKWSVAATQFARNHDVILFYTKSTTNTFHHQFVPLSIGTVKRWKGKKQRAVFDADHRRLATSENGESKGTPMPDWWELSIINPNAAERLGYPTQKPAVLLDRIILASSNEGDVVLDPFCGCGTTIESAEKLGRDWIGIDITHLAITLIKHRLKTAFSGASEYAVVGEPVSLPDAHALAEENRFQFQCWALGLVGARPSDPKRGADQGIDGRLHFHDDKPGLTKQIVISVKSGAIPANHIRELRGVVEREDAALGLLITLQEPTRPVVREAASAGLYTSPFGNTKHPRIQILTIEELLGGRRIDCPRTEANVTFKKARRIRPAPARPGTLPFE